MSDYRTTPRRCNGHGAMHHPRPGGNSIARDTLGGIAALALPWAVVTALAALKAAGIW